MLPSIFSGRLPIVDNYAQVAAVLAPESAFLDGGVLPGTLCTYQVFARDNCGESPNSPSASATTPPSPPFAPTSFHVVSVDSRQVKLAWSFSGNSQTGFKVERKTSTDATFTQFTIVPGSQLSFTDISITSNTTYSYQVAGVNAGGDGSPSNSVTVTTTPAAPIGPSLTKVSYREIDLSWSDLSGGTAQFKIFRKSGIRPFAQVGGLIAAGTAAYRDTVLVGGMTYTYYMVATNANGDSAPSNQASSTTFPTPPPQPTYLTVQALSSSSNHINWLGGAGSTQDHFVIERKIGTQAYQTVGYVPMTSLPFTDLNLTPNTAYTYRVSSVNNGAISVPSTPVAVATL